MADCKLFRFADAAVDTFTVDGEAFGRRSPRRVQRQAVLMYEANRRAGTHSTKTRAEIKGNIKKPWKQKHTGRARAGRKSSPIWRGGGVAHGPRPRDYSYGVPRKALRAAARAAIAGKFLSGDVVFVDALRFEQPNTKRAAAMLAALGITRTCLVVTAECNEMAYKSIRNIEGADIMAADDVNAYEVLRHRTLVLTQTSFERLRERLATPVGGDRGAPEKSDA
jgi:large subunit ribosomal protein L4